MGDLTWLRWVEVGSFSVAVKKGSVEDAVEVSEKTGTKNVLE